MPNRPFLRAVTLALVSVLPAAGAGGSASDPAGLCEAAAAQAAATSGVPYRVLLAITQVETGRNGRPWPWTVNLGGDGHWLDDSAAALALADAAIAQGAGNIDLGCFQLNYRWHATAFPNLAAMLDPAQNAAYAADYLAQHYADTGDWALAAAAYHSATPEHAARYRGRFEAALAASGAEPLVPAGSAPPPLRGPNRFPLLRAGGSGQNGSLVPATAGGTRLIGGP